MIGDVAALTTSEGSSETPRKGHRWPSGMRSRKAVAGLVILMVFALVALFGPMAIHRDPSAFSDSGLTGPSSAHWLGTTQTGQDIFTQLVYSTRVSMWVGFVSAAIATVLSLLVGLVGGYFVGIVEEGLSTLSNIFLVIPALPLVIVLAGYLPSSGSLTVAVVISVTGWAWGARVIRSQTSSIRRRDYIEAARASGESAWRIILTEILPNLLAIVAAGFLGTVIFAILTQTSIAFLGLSSISTWSWGTMLYWAQSAGALQLGAWWWFVPPGVCIGLVGIGLALVNFGLDEVINPRLRVEAPRRGRRAGRFESRSVPDRDMDMDRGAVASRAWTSTNGSVGR